MSDHVSTNRHLISHALTSSGPHFVSVVALAKDGERKTFVTSQSFVEKHLIGDAASDSAKKATETRKARHPNLVYVRDVNKFRELVKDGMPREQAFQRCSRSFDATRVLSLSWAGTRFEVNNDGLLVPVKV